MNEVLKTLKERRSCRNFLPDQIKDADLELILEAGSYAANGMGKQSPIMIAVQNPDDVALIAKMNAAVMGASGNPYYGAPTVVLVLARREVGTAVEDGALCMGNLMNAAQSLGISSIWIHREKEMFESEEGKALLKKWGVEGDYIGVGGCALGYSAAPAGPAAPRKEDRIYIIK